MNSSWSLTHLQREAHPIISGRHFRRDRGPQDYSCGTRDDGGFTPTGVSVITIFLPIRAVEPFTPLNRQTQGSRYGPSGWQPGGVRPGDGPRRPGLCAAIGPRNEAMPRRGAVDETWTPAGLSSDVGPEVAWDRQTPIPNRVARDVRFIAVTPIKGGCLIPNSSPRRNVCGVRPSGSGFVGRLWAPHHPGITGEGKVGRANDHEPLMMPPG